MLDMTLAIIDIIVETIAVIVGGMFLVCFLTIVAIGFAIQDIVREVLKKVNHSYYQFRYKL